MGNYNSFAVVRYYGTTEFASGNWVGLELPTPTGKNDGSVRGKRYFPCKHQHGVFVRLGACYRLKEDNLDDSGDYSAGNTPPLRALGRSSTAPRDSTISSVSLKPGGFKTPSKGVASSAVNTPSSPRLNRPFLSRATRESLLGGSGEDTKVSTARESRSSIATRTVQSATGMVRPTTSPTRSRSTGVSRPSAGTSSSRSSSAKRSSRLSSQPPQSAHDAEV